MTEIIVNFMGQHGYVAVFFLMILENVFPPIPSEVILPYVGHLAATGKLNFILALIVAAAGSLAGTSVWFGIGWFISVERLAGVLSQYGGYIAITVKDFNYAARFFEKHERAAVFFGRMIPAVRSVISIPAGSVHMKPRSFLFISFAGIFVWNFLLIFIGYFFLPDIDTVEKYINPISDLILIGILIAYLLQVLRFIIGKTRTKNESKRDKI